MNYKLATIIAVLIVGGASYVGWTVRQVEKPVEVINEQTGTVSEEQAKLENEIKNLQDRITTLEANKPKIVVIDKEQECAKQADKYFSEWQLDSDLTRSTYKSHWNTNLKACIMDITIRRTTNTGEVEPMAIVNLDITNNKVRNNCVMEAKKGEALSCENSIFLTFREDLMSQ